MIEGNLLLYYSAFSGMDVPCPAIYSVNQDPILVFDQQSEKLYNVLGGNMRQSPIRFE
jgi:hypothetical protein